MYCRLHFSDTRETAVLNAYMSAGAAHGIASACHENVIDGCKCQESTQTRREGDVLYLTSCGDDVNFATRVLRTLTGLEIGKALSQAKDLVSQWNNEIGYRVRSGPFIKIKFLHTVVIHDNI